MAVHSATLVTYYIHVPVEEFNMILRKVLSPIPRHGMASKVFAYLGSTCNQGISLNRFLIIS